MVLSLAPSVALAACTASSGTLCSQLTVSSVQDFVALVLKVIVQISLPVIAFFLVLTGYRFISAQGNATKLKAARENFLWVIIGAALILGAWLFATLIGSTISQILS